MSSKRGRNRKRPSPEQADRMLKISRIDAFCQGCEATGKHKPYYYPPCREGINIRDIPIFHDSTTEEIARVVGENCLKSSSKENLD